MAGYKVSDSYKEEAGGVVAGTSSKVILEYDDMQEQTGWIEIPETDGHLSISLNGFISDDPDLWPLDVRLTSNTGTTTMYRVNLYDYTNTTNPVPTNISTAFSLKSKGGVMNLTDITGRDLQTSRMILVYDIKAMDIGNSKYYHMEVTIVNYGNNKSQILSKRLS